MGASPVRRALLILGTLLYDLILAPAFMLFAAASVHFWRPSATFSSGRLYAARCRAALATRLDGVRVAGDLLQLSPDDDTSRAGWVRGCR